MTNLNIRENPLTPEQEEKLKKEAEAKKKREERLKKEAEAKKNLPPPKFYYDVKMECLLPATLTWRVLAENPMQAADLIRGVSPQSVKHRLIGRKDLKLMVYDAGSVMIKWIKKLAG